MRILEQKDSRTFQKISLPPRGLFLLLVTEPVSELALTVFAALELDLDTGMNRNSPVIHIGQITWLGPIDLLKRDIVMVLNWQHGVFLLKCYLRKTKCITEIETAFSR